MFLSCVTFNHKITPLDVRERIASDGEGCVGLAQRLIGQEVVAEAFVVSTCNRTEVYAVGACLSGLQETVYRILSEKFSLEVDYLKNTSNFYGQEEAVRHLFRVAASLDAMVVGEAQILGQIKSAYQMAVEHETVGPYLHKACHAAFRVAKRVRSETEVADGPVSVGTLAVDIITKEIGDLRNANVLLIGAGEMGNLVALHLKERGAGHIWISNRTAVAAEMLAKEVGGTVVPFESWPSHLHTADVVVASIGGGTLITGKHVEDVLKIGSRKKMVMMDLGLPRNIEPAVKNLGVRLFNIDDLDEIAKENLRIRKRAALKAEDIVRSECGTAFDELRTIKLAPVLENLRKKCSFVADEELLRLFKENPGLTLDEQASIRRCVSAIVKKLIHEPVRAAKQEMILGEPSDGGALQVLNKLVM